MRRIEVLCFVALHLLVPSSVFANDESIKVMTFNIRYGTASDGENVWSNRRALVVDMLREENPQVVGIQEALREQLDFVLKQFPHFSSVGVGRDADGGGEYSPLLYDRTRFDVLESQTFWLSDTPQERGTRDWGNHFNRICTWARFIDRSNNRVFRVYNTHWDHQSQPSRLRSGELMAERLRQIELSEPLTVMGDFNCGPDNPARTRLTDVGLRDSFLDRFPSEKNLGTFHGFTGESTGSKIDAILVSADWRVLDAAIVRSRQGNIFPSDHYPVAATLSLEK